MQCNYSTASKISILSSSIITLPTNESAFSYCRSLVLQKVRFRGWIPVVSLKTLKNGNLTTCASTGSPEGGHNDIIPGVNRTYPASPHRSAPKSISERFSPKKPKKKFKKKFHEKIFFFGSGSWAFIFFPKL